MARLIGLLILVLCALPARGAGEPLSWEDCVRLAAERNPSLAAAGEQVRAAEFGVGAARAALRPQLSLGAAAEHAEQDGQSTSGDASLSASVGAEQSLYSGGRNAAAVDSARAALEGARAEYADADAEITHRLRSAFVNLLTAQEQVVVLRLIEQRRRDNLELVDLRYEGGREHKGSLAMIEASLYQARVELRQAEREVDVARRVLARTMGWPGETPAWQAVGSLHCGEVPADAGSDALAAQTPSYARARASTRSAEAGVRSARSGYRPSLSLAGGAGRYGDTDDFETDRWSVGVRLSFPFWQGGRTRQETAQARARLAQAEARESETLDGLVSELSEALLTFQNATENVQVQSRYFEAADLRANIAREQYGAGLLTFENWDVIENERISHQRRLLETQRAALLAEAAWRRALGRGEFAAKE